MAGTQDTTDIIYPECHLNSPIVTGKLVELVFYTQLPLNQKLLDPTLVKNLKSNIDNGRRSFTYTSQLQLGNSVRSSYPNFSSLNHIPYPSGNYNLFRRQSNQLTRKFTTILNYAGVCYRKLAERLVRLRKDVSSSLGLREEDYQEGPNNQHEIKSILHMNELMAGSPWYLPFCYWFTLKTEMRDLIKNSKKDFRNNRVTVLAHHVEDHSIFLNRNLVVMIDYQSLETHYLTFEMVLLMCDVVEGRLMIDLGMTSDYRFAQLKPKGRKLWEFIDCQFVDLGNHTYDLVAMIEPLVLGFLQLKDPSTLLQGAFLEYCLTDLLEIYKSNGFTDQKLHDQILDIIFDIFNLDDVHMISEFFSFFRTFGHPTLEAFNAAEKVRSHMNKPKVIKFITLMKGHALFCSTIINGYRDRHGGAWPPLTLPNHASMRIRQAQNNSEGLTDDLVIRNWQSFSGIKFKCFMPLTLDEDLTMYMKDKALAAMKSEWDSVYPKEVMVYDPPKQTTSRRLVEVFLQDSEFDPSNLINYVISGEYLRDPEFNISYSLKEKEIKQVGRLFAKMPYKMRACQVVAESLISTGIGKYFKENGMAKDEHELLKTLHKLSVSSVPKDNKSGNMAQNYQGKKYPDSRNPPHMSQDVQYETISTFLTTDLQKYCLNWRQETTNIFAERLNEIYGLPNFFNWQHKILEKSVLYVADPYCPPFYDHHIDLNDCVNDQIFIKYPMGGIEGYSQKLWTISTIPFLFLSAYEVGAKIAAVVQGDNQAIAITMRVHPNLPYKKKKNMCSRLAQQYFYRLRENLADIGHNLKANETIVSSNFFVYSKRIYWDGLVLSQSLKPLSRVVFWSETIVDETRSACSNIGTAISKSIEQGFSRWIGYSINTLKIIQQLLIALKFGINPALTSDITSPIYNNIYWVISAALVPSQIGGFNYMNLSRLYVRNIGDPVTASFADLKRLIKAGLLNESILQKILHQKSGQSTYLDWASDPYSVNIPNSQNLTTMLKNITSRTILQNSENPMLKGLFHFDFEKEDHDLAQFLLDRPIIIPRAAHEIMDKSLTGARQEISGMLDSTKGLIRNSIRAGGVRPGLLTKITMYDYEQYRVFNDLMSVKEQDPLITAEACSVKLAITLRKKMWRDLAQGRLIYGLEVPDTIEVVSGYFLQECEDCYYCSANRDQYGWFFCPKFCELDIVNKETNSLRVPYFGSTTEERSEIKLSNIKNASRALKSAIRIATVYTWAFGDSDDNWNEAWYLASFRANVTLDELRAITPISTSNNIAHRLRDKSTQMKYSSTALNRVGRYVTISNDKLNFIIDGRKVDTNVVYQQIMLIGLSILEEKFRFQEETGEKNTVLHLHIQSNCCVQEMSDHPYVESSNILPVLQRVEGNKLIYDDNPIIESSKNLISQQIFKSGVLDFPRWSIKDLHDTLSKSLAATLVEIITKENKDHLSEFKTLSSDDDINSLITEFMLVDPEQFCLDFGMYIAVNWAYDIYYRRPIGKYQMLEYLSTILSTASKGLFQVLANAFSHPKIFHKFWDSGLVEPIYGPNLSSQDFIKLSIDFILKSYQNYLNFWLDDGENQYILNEGDEIIVEQRFDNLQAKHLCMLASLYLERERMPKIINMTSLEKCAILSERLQEDQTKFGIYSNWHLDVLDIINYPASTTYLRRGSIKHIRLRQSLSAEAVAYDKILANRQPVREFHQSLKLHESIDQYSHYFPITAIYTSDYIQLQDNPWQTNSKNYWENHVTRRVGINSSSCYKALELSHYLQDKVQNDGPRMFLGEGSGAMMMTYYQSLGKAICYYNTGVFNREVLGQRILTVSPSEALMVEKQNPLDLKFSSNLRTLFNGKPESSWVGSDENFAYIMSQIEAHSLSFIHSDMETSCEKDQVAVIQEQVYALCLAINLGNPQSVFVTKLAPEQGSYTTQLLNLLMIHYEEVFGFIPSSSNPYSSEFYIVCSYPKIKTLVNPQILLKTLDFNKPDVHIQVGNIITNFKLKSSIDKNEKLHRLMDYSKSDLKRLTKDEKILLSYGFQMNGPKCIRTLTGYDIGSGEETLLESIRTTVNNLLIMTDKERESTPFFDPYPLKDDSKIREVFTTLSRKCTMYYLITKNLTYMCSKRNSLQLLRRKHLVFDMNDEYTRSLLTKSLINRYNKSGLKRFYIYHLDTAEVKLWWKAFGYVLLLEEEN
ncbi:RNA polymerase [Jingmen Miniopterus schreibersii paramyxovirus 2]|nr:RNA polymerase [Jingmen Miniopterus schreibersii paramyxovirus 2]